MAIYPKPQNKLKTHPVLPFLRDSLRKKWSQPKYQEIKKAMIRRATRRAIAKKAAQRVARTLSREEKDVLAKISAKRRKEQEKHAKVAETRDVKQDTYVRILDAVRRGILSERTGDMLLQLVEEGKEDEAARKFREIMQNLPIDLY